MDRRRKIWRRRRRIRALTRLMTIVILGVGVISMGVWGVKKISGSKSPDNALGAAATMEPDDWENKTGQVSYSGAFHSGNDIQSAENRENETGQLTVNMENEPNLSGKISDSTASLTAAAKTTAKKSGNKKSSKNKDTNSTVSGKTEDTKYFDDAVFIGDSRTEGFGMYSGLKNATFYTHKGLMVDTIFKLKTVKLNGSKVTILNSLKKKQFGKVYIMMGVNELGWVYDDIFIDKYKELIESIKKVQPDAVIYIQGILHVSKEKSDKDKTYNNSKINKRNKLIKKMAQEEEVEYLEVNEAVTDKNGALYAKASTDGVHLNKTYCLKWKDYLMEHIKEKK